MKKHKDLGLNNRYVVQVFGGGRTTKTALLEDSQQKYDPDIFPLYQSYSQKKVMVILKKSL